MMESALRIGNISGGEKGWAVINSNGRFGDEIVAGYLTEKDAEVCLAALVPTNRNGRTWAMSEWQPIETAPRDGTEILLWEDGYILGSWVEEYGYFADPDGHLWKNRQPTHWMPLPAPPQGA